MQPGELIHSRYRLIRILGSGSSGTVWHAKNELIDRDVALKVLRPEVADDAVKLQRFFNEAKAGGRVRSPSNVEILDLGQAEDGSPFLVFELLDGEGIDTWLKRETTIEPETLFELLVGVARALDIAHKLGIVHRDLKPANIYVHHAASGERVAKVLDFGISKIFESEGRDAFNLTRAGTVVGSPAYMSPEQAAGRDDLDGRADVWSLGVVMFEALTGTLPHDAPNYNALMVRILVQDADPVAKRNPNLPAAVCTVVDGCLRRDREQRMASSGVLAQQMEAALKELRSARYGKTGRRAGDRSKPGSGGSPSVPGAQMGPSSSALVPMLQGNAALAVAGIGLAVGLTALVVSILFR